MEIELLKKRSVRPSNLLYNVDYKRFKKGNMPIKPIGGIIDVVELAKNYDLYGIKSLISDLKHELKKFKFFYNWPIKKEVELSNRKKFNLQLRTRKNKKFINLDYIQKLLYEDYHCSSSMAKMLVKYNNQYPNNKISYSTLIRNVKKNLGYKFAKAVPGPIKKYDKEILPEIIIFLLRFIRYLKNEADIYFFDEATFKNHKTNEKIWRRKRSIRKPKKREINKLKLNLLFICSLNSTLHFSLEKRNTNSFMVNLFLQKAINKIMMKEEKDIVILVDNASYHSREQMQELAQNNRVNILFLPRYSPLFNMAENAFCLLKRKVKELDPQKLNRPSDFRINLEKLIRNIRSKDFNIIFKHFLKYLNIIIHDLIII